MFSFGFASVLGNRDNSTKMAHNLVNDGNFHLPYTSPYEASPRAITPHHRHKQRDSWGDPIPFVTTDSLQLSGDGDVLDKRKPQQYETRDIKYGVRGVFDDEWQRVGTSGTGRIGVPSEKERGRRASCGRDQSQPSFGPSDPVKSAFSTTSRRRSTISSGNSLTVPNYMSLDGVSGGVGESPVPQRRAQKDANRISLGSIFTFGSKMRMGSPSRGMDDDRREKEEKMAVRPTSDPEKGRVPKPSRHEKHSTSNNRKNKQTGPSNEKEGYYDHYNSLYPTLVMDEDNGTLEDRPHSTRHKRSPERFRQPSSTLHDSRAPPRPRTVSHQNVSVPSVGHPYAPYAHQSQAHHDRGLGDEISPFPASDNTLPIFHRRHPYNQAQPVYTRHPYGQSSVSTGTSSPSHITPFKRGSGQSECHGDCQQVALRTNTTAVAPGIEISITRIDGAGLEPGIHDKKLKISRSTPNFHHSQTIDYHDSAAGPSNAFSLSAPPMPSLRMKQLPPPRPKDRWLSAETWCDALLFPRPKLKLKQGKKTAKATLYSQGDESFIGGPAPSESGRIISPPPSPVGAEWGIGINGEESRLRDQWGGVSGEGGAMQKQREPGVPSRVLAHSRSFDSQTKAGKEKAGYIYDLESRAVRQRKAKAAPAARDTQDILRPATPVPDLDEVLSEGRLLDEERQAWQTLAVNSFGNKRSRSLSRTRTKSLTRKGRSSMRRKERNTDAEESDEQGGERGQSSFEYLAAHACLGNQTASATFVVSQPNPNETKTSGTHSHLHSNSQSTTAKTLTNRSSKSQSKVHSRNNSIGNPGAHAGRISVGKLCSNMGRGVDLDLDHIERANLVSNAASPPQSTNIRTAPDLEGALKRHGTKVIRLADPAHIPVDKGLPVSQPVSPNPLVTQSQRKSPSPDLSVSNLSAISHSKVGIAIGTPPEEAAGAAPAIVPAGPVAVSASYVPSHPYAQGGLSFSVQTSSGKERPIDSRGPPSSVLPLSEILAQHNVSPHPYALTSGNIAEDHAIQSSSRLGISVARDSYLTANGLIGQFRSDDNKPDPSRMWAQLSPDVVREILPGDLQYSPYDSNLKGIEKLEAKISGRKEDERMRSIHDTAGVAEALLSATGYGRDRDILDEEHKNEDCITIDRMNSSEKMQPNDTDFLVALNSLRKPSHTSSAHTIASSHLDGTASSTPTRLETLDGPEPASHAPTGFRLLGSPNDLDSFQDLFYQPSTTEVQDSPASPDSTANVVSWDAAVRNRRTGSSLTSLARQLGEEYEALVSVDASRAGGMHLHPRPLGAQPRISGLSTEGNLEFVLEDMASAESPHRVPIVHETVYAFGSANLPEDVYSLQASSIMDGNGDDDDPTGLLRLGTVESLSTPTAVDVEHRVSFNGETIFDYEDQGALALRPGLSTDIGPPGNTFGGMESQRPLTQVTRSSCMTTSDLSRMSGLSDFPVPPKSIYSERPESLPTLAPRHLSALNTYSEGERKGDVPPPNSPSLRPEYVKPLSISGRPRSPVMSRNVLPQDRRVEFGVNQSAVELAKSLSSPEPM